MQKNELLKTIAQTAYNVGFGAKKHFVTYDLYRLMPRTISFIVLAVGIFQLTCIYKELISTTYLSDMLAATLIILGFLGFTIDLAGYNKKEIESAGKNIINLFNQLRILYYEAKNTECNNYKEYIAKLRQIEDEFKQISISDLAIGINLLTHFAFFGGSTQIDWIDEQLNFKLKDKFPFFHYESIILYFIIIFLLTFIIHLLAKLYLF